MNRPLVSGMKACLVWTVLVAGPALAQDADVDGVPDTADLCPGSDDGADSDSDGTPDGCDCEPDDPLIHRDVPDVCDGLDNNCDGRPDRNTVIYTQGAGLVSRIGRGLATNYSERAVTATTNGFASVGPSSENNDIYYAEPVDLVTSAGTREVEVLVNRSGRLGDHDFVLGFTDGERVVTAGLFNSQGMIAGAPAYASHVAAQVGTFAGGAFHYETQKLAAPLNWQPSQSAYFFTFTATALATSIRIRGTDGALYPAIELTGAHGLDPTVPWTFLLVGNNGPETYVIQRLEVRQPVPAADGALDEDQDGFSVACDCDDLDPDVHPRQVERCDGKDRDCRPQLDEDLYGVYGGTGVRLLEDRHEAIASTPTQRPISVDGTDLVIGGGPPGAFDRDIVFRRRLEGVSVPADGTPLQVSVEIGREARAGDHDFEVGLASGAGTPHILSAALYDVGGLGEEVTAAAAWGTDSGDSRGDGGELPSASPLPDAGRFLATFTLSSAGSSLRVQASDGSSVAFDYPGSAPVLSGPLDLVLIARGPEQSYRIHSVDVSVPADDVDEDGICVGLDFCAGYDGAEDQDGDGVRSGCDCDDTDPGVHPGALEICDGVDQDCDGFPDLQRVGGGVGPELAAQIMRGDAGGAAEQFTLVGEGIVDTPFDYRLGYEKALGVLDRGDGTVALKLRVNLQGAKALALSDGTRAITLDVRGTSLWLGTRRQAYLDPGYGFGCVSPYGPHLSSCTWGASFGIAGATESTVVDLTFISDAGGQRVEANSTWGGWYFRPGYSAIPDGKAARIPSAAALDLQKPITMYAYGAGLGTVQASVTLDDGDGDLVCDARDRCSGADDRQDADADNVPDGCDVCLGTDGIYDDDGDGWPSGCDCDDDDADIHPDAVDVCNAIDDDCDQRVDDDTVYALVGAEMKTRREQGLATGHPNRTFQTSSDGQLTWVNPGSVTGEVYFRQPLGPLDLGPERKVTMRIDRALVAGDHDFTVGLSDGVTAALFILADTGGTFDEVVAGIQATPDSPSDVIPDVAYGNTRRLAEAPPYDVTFVFDDEPRVELLSAAGERLVIHPAEAAAMSSMSLEALDLIFVGNHAAESYRFRSLEIRQSLTDSDGDQVCDAVDHCPGADDLSVDSDEDGIVDFCDVCPFGPDDVDSDGDGVADACDVCEGSPDEEDEDGDGIADGCDACPDDYANDNDGDGVCDLSDVCFGGDDTLDFDGDGIPDDCDACPLDVTSDSDEDGSCDAADVCVGNDRSGDLDGDGYCADVDCDDTRASVRPGAEEICDGFDSDCSGALGAGELDADQDGVIDCLEPAPLLDAGPEPEPKPEPAPATGCGCTQAASGGDAAFALALLGLAALRRRRAVRAASLG